MGQIEMKQEISDYFTNKRISVEQDSKGAHIMCDKTIKSVKVQFNNNTTINNMEVEFFETKIAP